MTPPLHKLTIRSFQEGLRDKKFSAREVTEALFSHIEKTDGEIGAYLSLLKDAALAQANETDAKVARGEELPPLAGVPLAIKDNILIKGTIATSASQILKNYRASYDAGVIAKLKQQQAVFLGKTNLDEFAMGASTENSGFQVTKNPRDTSRVPGGSSGGSAAAVAADMALASLGSDTGGSIRQPASLCGVVGLKTTYGSVSRSGLMAMASSLDQIGPLAKTVEDAAMVFQAIAGPDPLDATAETGRAYGPELSQPDFKAIKNLTVGLPDEYFIDGVEPEVTEAVEGAIETLKAAGVRFKKVSLPHTKYALSCYYIIVPAEVSSNMARFDGIRYARDPRLAEATALSEIYLKQRGLNFGAEVKRRIILGTFVLSSGYYDAYYAKAQQVRSLVKHDFEEAFKDVDVIMAPVSPTRAFKIGEKVDDPLAMYLSDIFTIPINLAGVPSVSVPAAVGEQELPVGFQLIGRHFREADVLGLGMLYEAQARSR